MAQRVKRLPAMWETWVQSLDWEDPLKKEMLTHSSILSSGKSHGWRNLVGYSPQGHKESDTTEQLHFLSFSKMFSEKGSSAECILLAYAASLGCDLTLQGWELTGP